MRKQVKFLLFASIFHTSHFLQSDLKNNEVDIIQIIHLLLFLGTSTLGLERFLLEFFSLISSQAKGFKETRCVPIVDSITMLF